MEKGSVSKYRKKYMLHIYKYLILSKCWVLSACPNIVHTTVIKVFHFHKALHNILVLQMRKYAYGR